MSDEKVSDEIPWKYVAKTPEQIETLAWDIIGDRVFGSWSCPPELLQSCFMVLLFLERKHLDALKEANIAHMYEYIDKAGPRAVNGYPCFFSCSYINADDMKKVADRIKQIEEFQQATGPKMVPKEQV